MKVATTYPRILPSDAADAARHTRASHSTKPLATFTFSVPDQAQRRESGRRKKQAFEPQLRYDLK
jgi:hypothetical protein